MPTFAPLPIRSSLPVRRLLRPWSAGLLAALILLMGAAGVARGQAAGAEPAKAARPAPAVKPGRDAGVRFGVVVHVSGEVTLLRSPEDKGRALVAGDSLYVGERVRTGVAGEALVKTEDAGMVGVRPGSEFFAEKFVATGHDSDAMALRLARGSLRVITGWIGRLHPSNYEVVTPSATIGVRGTDHEPFVLVPEAATGTPYKAGSYDKVNQGRTFISAAGRELDIEAGQVGVAPDLPNNAIKTRGLMTLALPYLLDHVPEFYRGGKFEDELDAYSKSAEQISIERHQQLQGATAAPPECVPLTIARAWIERFDDALQRRQADVILGLFSEDATVQISVRDGKGGMISRTLSRAEFATSSAAATAGLTDFRQQRDTLDSDRLPGQSPSDCQRIYVESQVSEQGRMNGTPYRIESREEYVLEQRGERWLAVHAVSTQR